MNRNEPESGYVDEDDFIAGNIPEIESRNVGAKVLRPGQDVDKGDRVRLMWPPMRICVIEYMGNDRWPVVSSEGTRLEPGDTFYCTLIVSGEPLYLDRLEHGDSRPGTYVCGRRSGVKFVIEE